jgi:hypothetical protein
LIDCVILDPEHLCYKPRLLVFSVVYVVLSFLTEDYTVEDILQIFSTSSQYLQPWNSELNIVFRAFLSTMEDEQVDLQELLPEIQFVSKYFAIKLDLDSPKVLKKANYSILRQNYDEFLSYFKLNNDSLQLYKELARGTENS